jgi:hypothetical protein
MKLQINTTYIDKPEYYNENRVIIIRKIETDENNRIYVIASIINFDTQKQNGTRMSLARFLRMFEFSPIQMR